MDLKKAVNGILIVSGIITIIAFFRDSKKRKLETKKLEMEIEKLEDPEK